MDSLLKRANDMYNELNNASYISEDIIHQAAEIIKELSEHILTTET